MRALPFISMAALLISRVEAIGAVTALGSLGFDKVLEGALST